MVKGISVIKKLNVTLLYSCLPHKKNKPRKTEIKPRNQIYH